MKKSVWVYQIYLKIICFWRFKGFFMLFCFWPFQIKMYIFDGLLLFIKWNNSIFMKGQEVLTNWTINGVQHFAIRYPVLVNYKPMMKLRLPRYIDVSRWIWPLCWVHINAIIYLGNAPTWALFPNLYHNGFKLFLKERYFFSRLNVFTRYFGKRS